MSPGKLRLSSTSTRRCSPPAWPPSLPREPPLATSFLRRRRKIDVGVSSPCQCVSLDFGHHRTVTCPSERYVVFLCHGDLPDYVTTCLALRALLYILYRCKLRLNLFLLLPPFLIVGTTDVNLILFSKLYTFSFAFTR